MKEMLANSVYFGVAVSVLSYLLGAFLRKKTGFFLFHPLLVAIVITLLAVVASGMTYEQYNAGARYLSYLLTPATVCLAIPLYEQISLLRKNYKAILAGILSGTLTSLGSIWVMARLFGLSHAEYVTLLPKSVTTAIGMGISEELGGVVPLTVAVIVITGILGNLIGSLVCKLFRIREPIARGVALGTSAHAIGTTRAMEMGDTEGAMSGLSIAVAGIITVVFASVFAML